MAGGVTVSVKTDWKGTPYFNTRMNRAVEKIARDLGAHWQSGIRAVGSVDTGAYLNSIEAEAVGDAEWVVHDGVEHGIYNEFGTHRMPARPALQPALALMRPQIAAIFRGRVIL